MADRDQLGLIPPPSLSHVPKMLAALDESSHPVDLNIQVAAATQHQNSLDGLYCYADQYLPAVDYFGMGLEMLDMTPAWQDHIPPPPPSLEARHMDAMPEIAGSLPSSLELTRSNSTPSIDSSLPLARRGSSPQESPDPDRASSRRSSRDAKPRDPSTKRARDRKERRKEQNRKAQRNHRMRNEARLEQLCTTIRSQSHEIAQLKEANQSLQRHLDTLRAHTNVKVETIDQG